MKSDTEPRPSNPSVLKHIGDTSFQKIYRYAETEFLEPSAETPGVGSKSFAVNIKTWPAGVSVVDRQESSRNRYCTQVP